MQQESCIIITQYLWSNKSLLKSKYERDLNIPIPEEEHIQYEWRETAINIRDILKVDPIYYAKGQDEIIICEITLKHSGVPYILNIKFDEMVSYWSVLTSGNPAISITPATE